MATQGAKPRPENGMTLLVIREFAELLCYSNTVQRIAQKAATKMRPSHSDDELKLGRNQRSED